MGVSGSIERALDKIEHARAVHGRRRQERHLTALVVAEDHIKAARHHLHSVCADVSEVHYVIDALGLSLTELDSLRRMVQDDLDG